MGDLLDPVEQPVWPEVGIASVEGHTFDWPIPPISRLGNI